LVFDEKKKIMVNKNHFQFDRKIFNFLKTIYGFSGFKLFTLARMFVEIRYCWALEFVGNPTLLPKISEF
jgi:hypothetical protein